MRCLLVMVFAFFMAASAGAQKVFSAKALMELDEADAAMFIMGWMAGYDSSKSISTYNENPNSPKLRVCVPPNTNGKIAFAVIQAHYNKLKATQIEGNTSAWAMVSWAPAGMFVHGALAAYWPCEP